ncbi:MULTISPECIES: LuxR C-terminal-related transcriptional regulator [unclassified Serratia (in: enterobacteria)]|uniref:LuxR C-terminal-related transcriptional regulator n=1 Tax=unclassified Serratia (in: enterobacteria) TaxID=2647522 RepID=UPI0018ABBEDB|nr:MULTISPECIES: LuxR C-terminal-related transcriptional regulator [unclassified Serratia (in: enterobacteria)]
MTSIALMNHCPITVLGIKSVLAGLGASVNYSTSTTVELLAFLKKNTVSSVICDIPVVDNSATNTTSDFLSEVNELISDVIIFTSCTDRNEISPIIREYSCSIISSQEECGIIELQLDKALRGYETLSPKILTILNSKNKMELDDLNLLTIKERETLFHLLSGRSISQIAIDCSKSVKTISAHKIKIMRKLGVDNVTQLFSKIVRL